MTNSNFILILRTFSRKELNEFGKFLLSPFHNNADYLFKYYSQLRKFYPAFSQKNFSGDKIFAKLYPGRRFSSSATRKILSELTKLANEYLILKNLSVNLPQKYLNLLSEYGRRDLKSLLCSKLKAAKNLIEESRENPEINYYNFRLQNFFNQSASVSIHGFSKSEYASIEYFQKFFLTVILKNYTETIHLKHYYDGTIEERQYLNEIIESLYKNILESEPLIEMFYVSFQMVNDYENYSHYKNLLVLINKNSGRIDKESLFILYNEIQNYYWVKIYNGNVEFEPKLFKLYKDMLKKKVFDSHKYFPHVFFDNICAAGFNAGNPGWSEKFIKQYEDRLNPQISETVIAYNLAALHYARKNFEKALEILSKISFIDNTYKLRIKSDMLKIQFELKMFESAFSTIDAIKHYISRDKKTSKEFNLVFKNFALFTNELLMQIQRKDKKGLDFLRTKIISSKNLMHKPWLLEKIAGYNHEY